MCRCSTEIRGGEVSVYLEEISVRGRNWCWHLHKKCNSCFPGVVSKCCLLTLHPPSSLVPPAPPLLMCSSPHSHQWCTTAAYWAPVVIWRSHIKLLHSTCLPLHTHYWLFTEPPACQLWPAVRSLVTWKGLIKWRQMALASQPLPFPASPKEACLFPCTNCKE